MDGVTTGRLTMSQEMALYLSIYEQHELDIWIINFFKKDMKLGGTILEILEGDVGRR